MAMTEEIRLAAIIMGRKGGKARKGRPGRVLTSEEAKRIRAIRTEKQAQKLKNVSKIFFSKETTQKVKTSET